MNETDEARSELKIRRIGNGWLLKIQSGWTAHNTVDDLLAAIRTALTTEPDGQGRFFHSGHPGRKPNA